MIITGSSLILEDNINTDEIIPGRYLSLIDPNKLASHVFEDIHPDFLNKIRKTGIIVAGINFGCGSSREQAAISLKYAGVKAIVAQSFARIFFRNALNIGLPLIEIADTKKIINPDDKLQIHIDKGIIDNISTNKKHGFQTLPEWMQEMIETGGYIPWSLKK